LKLTPVWGVPTKVSFFAAEVFFFHSALTDSFDDYRDPSFLPPDKGGAFQSHYLDRSTSFFF